MSKKNSRPSIKVTAEAFDSKKTFEVVDFKTGDDLNEALNFLLRLCGSSIASAAGFIVDNLEDSSNADVSSAALFIAEKFGKDLIEIISKGFSSLEEDFKAKNKPNPRKKGGDA